MPYKDIEKRREVSRKHYQNNKKLYMSRAKAYDKEQGEKIRQLVWDYLKLHPCVDCPENDPLVLTFDHLDPQEKSISIGCLYRSGWAIDRVKAEIAKCVVRCANCHMRKTNHQLGWWKSSMKIAA